MATKKDIDSITKSINELKKNFEDEIKKLNAEFRSVNIKVDSLNGILPTATSSTGAVVSGATDNLSSSNTKSKRTKMNINEYFKKLWVDEPNTLVSSNIVSPQMIENAETIVENKVTKYTKPDSRTRAIAKEMWSQMEPNQRIYVHNMQQENITQEKKDKSIEINTE